MTETGQSKPQPVEPRHGMRLLTRLIGAFAGTVLALLLSLAILSLLSGGDAFFLAFLLMPVGGVAVLAGGIAGALLAPRAVRYFAAKSQSGAERRRIRALAVALSLSVPALVVFLFWFWRRANEAPSDAAMLNHFARHETTFTMLVTMANADKGLTRVDENWTQPTDTWSVGVSPERLATYRKLLVDAGTPRGFVERSADGHNGIEFFYWLVGSAISDDTDKGFAYMEDPPVNVLFTLDGVKPPSREVFTAYRHIHGNWYLFYEFIPD